jgi:hypothetical protein
VSVMFAAFPRLLGVLTALWTLRAFLAPTTGWSSHTAFLVASSLLGLAAVWLLVGRLVPVGAAILLLGGGIELVTRDVSNSPLILLCWMALLTLVTEGRPWERALLLRVCVSCVYGFTGLAKLNPSFLAGDQLFHITATRPMWGWAGELMAGPVGLALSWATVSAELLLAVGLWFPRLRVPVALLGVTLHVALIPVATVSPVSGVVFLFVLNFGLVVMYPAFWQPIRAQPGVPAMRHGTPDRSVSADGVGRTPTPRSTPGRLQHP